MNIFRVSTENSNFLGQLCGRRDKVFGDGELILPNNEQVLSSLKSDSLILNMSFVWPENAAAKGAVTTAIFFLRVFLLGQRADMAINLSVTFLEVTLKVGILKALCKWQ